MPRFRGNTRPRFQAEPDYSHNPLFPGANSADERVGAYLDTTKQMGLQNCGMYHISLDDPRSVQQAIATMLSLPDRPTAICAWSDYYALAVIHELQRSGIRVPEDMSVAGHDGSDVATGFGITTMAQPAREIGRMTAKTTLALINQEPLPEPCRPRWNPAAPPPQSRRTTTSSAQRAQDVRGEKRRREAGDTPVSCDWVVASGEEKQTEEPVNVHHRPLGGREQMDGSGWGE